MTPAEIETARKWFEKHGGIAVLPGGSSRRANTDFGAGWDRPHASKAVLALLTVGTGLWTTFLAGAGYLLQSQYDRSRHSRPGLQRHRGHHRHFVPLPRDHMAAPSDGIGGFADCWLETEMDPEPYQVAVSSCDAPLGSAAMSQCQRHCQLS